MPLLNYLQFQKIDESSDDAYDTERTCDDSIQLDEQIDEASLEKFWEQVVDDMHQDPNWFTFDSD